MLVVLTLQTNCTTSTDKTASDQYDTLYSPKYAKRFSLLKKGDSIILNIKNPWQGAGGIEKRYTITGSFKRIIAMSSSHLAFLDALESNSSVIGISGKNYINNPSYSNVTDIGYDRNMEFEQILSLKPDVMLVYEVSGENSSTFGKLSSLGINIIYIADYLEDSPLGRAEWIVVFGAFTGKINEAVEFFSKVESSYNSIKNTVTKTGKKVILNSPYQDIWYFPENESYPVRFIEDAGGIYVGKGYKGTNSIPVNMETAYRILKTADIWLNPSIGINSKKSLEETNHVLSDIDIPLFSNNKRCTPYGGSDFYETGVVRPDIVLKDLSLIFKYVENVPEDSLYFYRQIN